MTIDVGNLEDVTGPPILPEQGLWQAVIHQAWRDVLGKKSAAKSSHLDVAQARSWIGTEDFATVCRLAGYEPSILLVAFEARINGESA